MSAARSRSAVWVEVAGALAAVGLVAVLVFQLMDPRSAGWVRAIVAIGTAEMVMIAGGLVQCRRLGLESGERIE